MNKDNSTHLNNRVNHESMKSANSEDLVSVKLFTKADLTIKRKHSNGFDSGTDFSFVLITSILNDRCYQLYIEKHEKTLYLREKACSLIKMGVKVLEGHDATIEELWQGLHESMRSSIKTFVAYTREMPGFSKLTRNDFANMSKKRLYVYMMLKNSLLYMNDEYYLRLSNGIHYSKSWKLKIAGEQVTNAMFAFANDLNALNLTTKERSLLFPLALVKPCKLFFYFIISFFYFFFNNSNFLFADNIYEDTSIFQILQDFYKRALYYEFDVNKRDDAFINKISEVCFYQMQLILKKNTVMSCKVNFCVFEIFHSSLISFEKV